MANNINKILAIIPARSGSKGLKNKNTSIIFNRPLIYYSIKAAQESEFVEAIDGVYIFVHPYLLVYKPHQFEEELARLDARYWPYKVHHTIY